MTHECSTLHGEASLRGERGWRGERGGKGRAKSEASPSSGDRQVIIGAGWSAGIMQWYWYARMQGVGRVSDTRMRSVSGRGGAERGGYGGSRGWWDRTGST